MNWTNVSCFGMKNREKKSANGASGLDSHVTVYMCETGRAACWLDSQPQKNRAASKLIPEDEQQV